MAAFLLSLREGLEAALIVGILLGALRRLERGELRRFVWSGVASALVVSAAVAAGLVAVGVKLEGRTEQIFEGVTLLLAAAFLTGMIFWMQRQGAQIRGMLEADVGKAAGRATEIGGGWALWAVAFLAVVREGIELALLLVATSLAERTAGVAAGAALGIATAVLVGRLIYGGVLYANLRTFFRVTNLLLLLFAAGMVALGVHELVEASLLPAIMDPVYNVNPFLDDKSIAGDLLKSLFGYNGNPALIETLAYVSYLAIVAWFLFVRGRRQSGPRPSS
jgi:high-affinity iron transporter